MTLKLLDAFAGIGGFSYAAEKLVGGYKTKRFIEIDPYCQSVLKKNFPNVPIHNDITTFHAERGEYDVLTAGFPCQDISVAGSQRGIGEGTRSGLFYEVMRLVGEIRPKFVLLENVRNLISHQDGQTFQEILFQIAKHGYDAEWNIVSGRDLGACHERKRIWILCYESSYSKYNGLSSSEECRINAEASDQDQTGEDKACQSQGSSQSRGSETVQRTTESETTDSKSTRTGEYQSRLRGQLEGGSLQGAGNSNQEIPQSPHSNSEGSQGLRTEHELPESPREEETSRICSSSGQSVADTMRQRLQGEDRPRFSGSLRWPTPPTSRRLDPFWREYVSQPTLCRGDDGLSNRIPRLKALGNSIIPQCAAVPLQRIKHLSKQTHHANNKKQERR